MRAFADRIWEKPGTRAGARKKFTMGKMQLFRTVCFLAVTAVLSQAQTPSQQATESRRALPDDNLAYPVFITIGGSTGSGFYLNTKGATYLVTAKHVLFDQRGSIIDNTINLTSYSKDPADTSATVLTVDVGKLGAANVRPHPRQDVAVLKVASEEQQNEGLVKVLSGVTIHTSAKHGILGVGPKAIRMFDDVLIGNETFIMGYPTSLSLQSMPEIDPRRPLLRKGIIAGTNRTTRSIILDCPAYWGNSGGVVLEVDREPLGYRVWVIGVLSKYVPYVEGGKMFSIAANSGYSVAVPIDYVLELVK